MKNLIFWPVFGLFALLAVAGIGILVISCIVALIIFVVGAIVVAVAVIPVACWCALFDFKQMNFVKITKSTSN